MMFLLKEFLSLETDRVVAQVGSIGHFAQTLKTRTALRAVVFRAGNRVRMLYKFSYGFLDIFA